jgi:hypothetical protein
MEKPQKFIISGTNDKLWNYLELVNHLAKNQHKCIELKIIPEAIDLTNLGVYKLLDSFNFQKVDIYTENQLERHNKYNIINPWTNKWLAHQPTISSELHTWTCSKKFLAFYHRPTASRLGLASYLFAHYKSQSHIHFSYATDIDRLMLYEFDKLALFRLESMGEIASMLPYMPLYAYQNHDVDEIMTWYDYSRDPGITLYQDIFVDIISESHVAGNTFYPTEKTARPIWLKKPFIIFASKDYLCYLRQLGFRTFNDFWDEDYDGYEGRERYIRILQLIDSIAKKSKSELNNMYWSMKYTLDYNYNLLQTQSYNTNITKIT